MSIKEQVLHYLDDIKKKYKRAKQLGKTKKIAPPSSHEVSLAYSIADFLVIPCVCGSTDIEIKLGKGKKLTRHRRLNTYKIACRKCRASRGLIYAADPVSITFLEYPIDSETVDAIVYQHVAPTRINKNKVMTANDLDEGDFNVSTRQIYEAFQKEFSQEC